MGRLTRLPDLYPDLRYDAHGKEGRIMDRDYITIGAKLDEMIGLELSESDFESAGADFVRHTGHNDPHHLIKQVTFLERGLDILDFALCSIDKYRKSKPIMIMEDGAKCMAIVYNDIISESDPLMVRDLMEHARQFVLLYGVESRRPGAGEALVRKVIGRADGRVPILLQAGCEYAGDYFTRQTRTVRKNKAFYEAFGFRDVNDKIGDYGNSVVMVYCDDGLYEKIMGGHADGTA